MNKFTGMLLSAMGVLLMIACTLLNKADGHPGFAVVTEILAAINATFFLLWAFKPNK